MKAARRRKEPVHSAFFGSTAGRRGYRIENIAVEEGEYLYVYTTIEGMFFKDAEISIRVSLKVLSKTIVQGGRFDDSRGDDAFGGAKVSPKAGVVSENWLGGC